MKRSTQASLAFSAALLMPAAGLLAQGADIPSWQRMRDVPHGVMQRLEYQSSSINKAREALVYLPPGYDGATGSYPVLDMFSSVASFSPALQIANDPAWGGIDMNSALADADAINQLDLLWIGCGTEDSLVGVNRQFSEQLSNAGIEHTFHITPGAHTPVVWSLYLHEVLPQLF